MCNAYLDEQKTRWERYAYAARYGKQPLDVMLGRSPTEFELELFCHAIDIWIEREGATSTIED